MPQFSDEWLDKVKAAVDIVDLVGQTVSLRQAGKNYVGLCPFHDEKTPSFTVNPESQFFHCFGCGAGGNIFNFVMRTQSFEFPEAALHLGKQAGVPLPVVDEKRQKAVELGERMFEINQIAARYFYRNLRGEQGRSARLYLTERGIDAALARTFFIGYASPDWDGLTQELRSKDVNLSDAELAGLVISGKKGSYDRFRGRIIFPICDYQGRFVGFGGRLLGEGLPKYLNSPETPVFQKSQQLYGLNWAKDSIKESGHVVVVEGYTDCIGLYTKGITNVVASLGTSFTEQHGKVLARFTENVIIAFDGDAAGDKATKRGLHILKQQGLSVRVAALPKGYDPDSFCRSHELDAVQNWLASSLPLVEYLVKDIISRHDITDREGKLRASQELVIILAQLDNAIERDEYIGFSSREMHLDEGALRTEVERLRTGQAHKQLGNIQKSSHIITKNRYTSRDVPKVSTSHSYESSHFLERDIMRWLLVKPALVNDLNRINIFPDDFLDKEYGHLYALLISGEWDSDGEAVAARLFALPPPSGLWNEYLHKFNTQVCSRGLVKIEEKLSSLENQKEGLDINLDVCRLLRQYYGVRKTIFLSKEKM